MPEYLSPGVFIEEVPARLKAIEGVSTSTAAFVGPAERGLVPGYPRPFVPTPADAQSVVVPLDPTPVLVTSFADFTRQFGAAAPLPDPNDNAYLAYAVRAFFDNGGRRCYIARVAHFDPADPTAAGNATRSAIRVHQGVVLRLARPALVGDRRLFLNSLRRVDATGNNPRLRVFRRDGSAVTPVTPPDSTLTLAIQGYDPADGTVRLVEPLVNAFNPNEFFFDPDVDAADALAQTGPVFWARTPGQWSGRLTVFIANADRGPVPIAAAAGAGATEVQVQALGSFYRGAIVEVDHGDRHTYHEVTDLLPGNRLRLGDTLGGAVTPEQSVRVVEIDVIIADETGATPVVETFRALTWNPRNDPDLRRRHYSTVINARSRLVYVQPPGVGGLPDTESASIAHQPTTFNGFPVSPLLAANAAQGARTAIGGVVTAVNAAGAAIQAIIAAATFAPTTAAAAATAAATAATAAASAATNAATNTPGIASAARAAATNAAAAATAAATAATTAASAATPAVANAARTAAANAAAATLRAATLALQSGSVGGDGDVPDDDDYEGEDNGPNARTGIQALQDSDEIRIIAAPGRTRPQVQNALITQCERMRYRFAVLDGEQDPAGGSVNAVLMHRNPYDTSFAALYVPWVEITEDGRTVSVPPSGYVAGVYARVDNERGVHKAPANEAIRGITGLRSSYTTGEQDVLNPRGVDVIRRFEGRGIRVWGARTLSSDPEFRYVNVRRFLIFLEASLDRGTQWVVFEPNAPETWSRVTDSITAFLHTQWRGGALFGRRPEDAFFVRCDESTMSVDDIQNGRLICQIGVAIVRPAEFVIFRIEQITGFAQQT